MQILFDTSLVTIGFSIKRRFDIICRLDYLKLVHHDGQSKLERGKDNSGFWEDCNYT